MPVRIEELVFKTTIKADRGSDQIDAFSKGAASQPDLKQLKQRIIQELKNIAVESLSEDQER